MSTDKDWKKWGSNNPYFGVLSDSKFMGSKLDNNTLKEFYQSGESDIAKVVDLIGVAKFAHAIDFGCGVGRLTTPLTKYATNVTGIDVSSSILSTAKKATPKDLKKRVKFVVSDKNLSKLPTKYDLVHSFIVLQHIPPSRGKETIEKLLNNLSVGGFAALHITFKHEASLGKKIVISTRNHFLPLHYLLNVLKGHPLTKPRMRMYLYDLNEVIDIFNKSGITQATYFTTNHGGYIGAMLVGKKTAS